MKQQSNDQAFSLGKYFFNPEFMKERQFYYTSIASIGTLYSLYMVSKFQTQIIIMKYHKRKVEKAQIVDQQYLDNLIEKQRLSDILIESDLIFVDGVPQQGNLFSSQFNKEGFRVPLIQSIIFKQTLFSNSAFNDPLELLNRQNIYNSPEYYVQNLPQFNLLLDKSNIPIVVRTTQKCDTQTSLAFISSSDVLRKLSIVEWVAHGLTMFYLVCIKTTGMASIGGVLLRDLSFKGIQLGYRENEFGIKAQGLLSVLGRVVYDKSKQEFRIDNPLLITLSKNQYLKFIGVKLQKKYQKRNIWLLASGVLAFYLGRRVYKYYSANKQDMNKYIRNIFQRKKQDQNILLDQDALIQERYQKT